MINLENVTLVSMSSVNIESTIIAMGNSCEGVKYGDIKFISHERPNYFPDNFNFCLIDKINSVDQYSYNMIYKLIDYIDTEFALIIQSDGYVINPSSWRDEFLQYDYIGAPWDIPKDDFSFRDPFGNIIRVGNGGFSLRSRKILSAPNMLNLEWKPYFGFYNEDGFLTCHNRHLLEENGCKFAPLDVAKYFSHEAEIPEIQGIVPFGFHGKWSKYRK